MCGLARLTRACRGQPSGGHRLQPSEGHRLLQPSEGDRVQISEEDRVQLSEGDQVRQRRSGRRTVLSFLCEPRWPFASAPFSCRGSFVASLLRLGSVQRSSSGNRHPCGPTQGPWWASRNICKCRTSLQADCGAAKSIPRSRWATPEAILRLPELPKRTAHAAGLGSNPCR